MSTKLQLPLTIGTTAARCLGPDALLREASKEGSLQEVHAILSRHIVSQLPDNVTGQLRLTIFYESVREAIYLQYTSILSYLFFMRVGEPSVYIDAALEARSVDIFQVFLDYGWNLNKPLDRTKAPALGLFSFCLVDQASNELRYVTNDSTLTKWFLDHGADINARCNLDFTPMSEAMYMAPLEVIKLLFRHGVDINKGRLLHNAVLRSSGDAIVLVEMLLQRGAFINAIQYQDHTPSY
ncbi:MAG: hypothetical protein M1818_000447 [Claussenomyces sp. TS43310]|nr:MAG: hypothetical protein M1818_000447 [Claussenomyces sp. TS43310]